MNFLFVERLLDFLLIQKSHFPVWTVKNKHGAVSLGPIQ
jgi:hypothetical protein